MNRIEKHPTFQSLMDLAYSRQDQDTSGLLERMAVYLGNLNYQVCNGGFRQWVGNGYGLDLKKAVKSLEMVGTDNAKTVIQMLKRIEPHLDLTKEYYSFWGSPWKIEVCDCEDEDGCDFCQGNGEYEDILDFLGDLDRQYYGLNDKLLDEIEAYLSSHTPADCSA